ERDLLAVGRPVWLARVARGVRDPPLRAAVRAHDVDLVPARTVRLEGELLAVGRPGRAEVVSGARREPLLGRAVGVHHPDVSERARARAVEGDPGAVGRP